MWAHVFSQHASHVWHLQITIIASQVKKKVLHH